MTQEVIQQNAATGEVLPFQKNNILTTNLDQEDNIVIFVLGNIVLFSTISSAEPYIMVLSAS